MQSLSGAAGGGAVGDPAGDLVQVCFPGAQSSVLDSLNRQREDSQLCDLSVMVQGQVFRAHRCVLAASSPYFHDQVLLKNMSTVSIPAVMDPLAFESVLSCAYTGRLRMARDDIVNYLTVGSVLQMWHIVDKCTELLKEGRAAAAGGAGGGVGEGGAGSTGEGGAEGSRAGSVSGGATERQATVSKEEQEAAPPSCPALSESQSPSSTNYFSPRHGSGLGGGGATGAGASGEGGGANTTPSYCAPSGGEEAFLIEEEEEVMYHQRKRGGGGGDRRRKGSACEQEVGVSDSFGVSSYQAGEERRVGYSQSSTTPRKQWVVVKTEHAEDDDLILVSGEEEEEDEEEEDEEMALARERERDHFNISNVRSLSSELGRRASSHMDTQSDYCQSSEDYLRLESSLMEHTLAQHLHEAQGPGRGLSSLLGQQVQTGGPARGQLFPLAASFKGHTHLEHGAVHLTGLPPDAMDPGAGGMGGGAGGGGGASGKLFMCHCGKTFTHRSMRDRHVNMHLDLRPFHCPVCAKKFKMKHHLTEHMKTHTGLKPYRCGACARKFMWRDSYMRHRAQCERGGGEEPTPSPHFLLPSEEGGVGGRGNHSNAGMGGPAAVSQGQGSGLLGAPGGVGAGRDPCGDEDPCEARANDGSVT